MTSHPPDLLRFTPHLPRRVHANGWTPERQVAFIAALARTGVVREAARSVGMSARSAYQLRDRVRIRYSNWADAPMTPEQLALLGPGYVYSFAAAWDRALGRGLELQIEAALPVALAGEQEPVIRRGRILGWRTRFNTRLALAALGAFRRSHAGRDYDHEVRTAERTVHFAERLETLWRLGPIRWPDPDPAESPEARRAERRVYGRRGRGCGPSRGCARHEIALPRNAMSRFAGNVRSQAACGGRRRVGLRG